MADPTPSPVGRQRDRRRALLVATDDYLDPSLGRLRTPTGDVASLAEVLGDPEIGGFDVHPVLNQPKDAICEEIEQFFNGSASGDLVLLYVSCHGVLSPSRKLYFAATNTKVELLRSTGIPEDFIQDVSQHCRARRILLVLDCCHSGAYGQGMVGKGGPAPDLAHRFDGHGRATLTASTALEYAFEEDQSARPSGAVGSVFTRVLIEGLRTGDADSDEDGHISLDELYDYIYAGVRAATPHQTPGLTSQVHGDIWLAKSARSRVELPSRIRASLRSDATRRRLRAVQDLLSLALGADGPLAAAAVDELQKLVDDDSKGVAAAAEAAIAGLPKAHRPGRDSPWPAPERQIESKRARPEALQRGHDALRNRQPGPALADYEQALADEPASVDALTGCGWARFRLHRLADAEADFDRALAADPDHVAALVGRSRVLSERHQSDEALRDADRALTLDNDSAAAHVAVGEARSSCCRYADMVRAVAAYDAALRIEPTSIEALAGRSSALDATGDTSAALADAERAIATNPNAVEALLARAGALQYADAAAPDLERALNLDPDYASVHVGFLGLRLQQERFDDAAAAAERALELQPEQLLAALLLGLVHMAVEDYDAAVSAFQRAGQIQPKCGLPLLCMGGAHVELGENEVALHDFSSADRVDPKVVQLFPSMRAVGHTWRGRALGALGRPREALTELDAAVAADPSSAVVLYHRAQAHIGLDQLDAALSDLVRAGEIEPDEEPIQIARESVVRALFQSSPERLPGWIRRDIETKRVANVETLTQATVESGFYKTQRNYLLEQLTGTEDLIWLSRVARGNDVFRSVALVVTSEKLLWCRETAFTTAEWAWLQWGAIVGIEDMGDNGFVVTATNGNSWTFTQVGGGINLSGEPLDLSGPVLRDGLRNLVELTN